MIKVVYRLLNFWSSVRLRETVKKGHHRRCYNQKMKHPQIKRVWHRSSASEFHTCCQPIWWKQKENVLLVHRKKWPVEVSGCRHNWIQELEWHRVMQLCLPMSAVSWDPVLVGKPCGKMLAAPGPGSLSDSLWLCLQTSFWQRPQRNHDHLNVGYQGVGESIASS